VNLGFIRGASLPDPTASLGGTGKAMRPLRLQSADEVDRPGSPSCFTRRASSGQERSGESVRAVLAAGSLGSCCLVAIDRLTMP
jgi:hypothetical protein